VHQSKGAEFDYVFLAGLQENIFPSYQSIKNDDIDEEKRIFYVSITRARKQLFLSWSLFDEKGKRLQCRFIDKIPGQYIKQA
jgi:DNA helicase-2/ATP-dependent DNA helicase PcrA